MERKVNILASILGPPKLDDFFPAFRKLSFVAGFLLVIEKFQPDLFFL